MSCSGYESAPADPVAPSVAFNLYLASGRTIDVDTQRLHLVADLRSAVAEVLSIDQSRVELVPLSNPDKMLQNLQKLHDLSEEEHDLLVVSLPPHVLEMPEKRIEQVQACLRSLAAKQEVTDFTLALPYSVIAEVRERVKPDLGSIGEPPYAQVSIQPVGIAPGTPEGGFYCELSKQAMLGDLYARLCEVLELSVQGLHIMYEGQDLDSAKTLEENNILMPGPAARRRGEKVTFHFALPVGVVPGFLTRAAEEHAQRRGEAEWQLFMQQYFVEEQKERCTPNAISERSEPPEGYDLTVMPSWWMRNSGVYGEVQRFVPRSDLRKIVQEIVDFSLCVERTGASWRKLRVEAVLMNEDTVLWHRYSRARRVKLEEITAEGAGTGVECARHSRIREFQTSRQDLSACFGCGEESIMLNENFLFHGIDPMQLGIMSHNARIPKKGLWFSDCALSAGAQCSSVCHHLGPMHGTLSTLLLCRVICGQPELVYRNDMQIGERSLADEVRGRCRQQQRSSAVVMRDEEDDSAHMPCVMVCDIEHVYPEFLLVYRDRCDSAN